MEFLNIDLSIEDVLQNDETMMNATETPIVNTIRTDVSGEPSSKRRRLHQYGNIDDDDYRTVKLLQKDLAIKCERDKNDQEKRVTKITILGSKDSAPFHSRRVVLGAPVLSNRIGLPEDIGRLSALVELHARSANIRFVPPSIGLLKNLKMLDLSRNPRLTHLPEGIGNLANLEKLYLYGSYRFSCLPNSIGLLKKLVHLNVSTTLIRKLPDTFWELSSLQILRAENTYLSIPPSIEKLQNLKELDLGIQEKLPKEFGHLTKLRELDLRCPDECLPIPIENLHQLERLEIWVSPESWDVRKLDFVRNLPNLKALYFRRGEETQSQKSQGEIEFLLDLVRKTRIGQLRGVRYFGYTRGYEEELPQLSYALACNRFQHRTSFCSLKNNQKSTLLLKNLWPLMLTRVVSAFFPRKWSYRRILYSELIKQKEASKLGVDVPTLVYKLLLEGRGSFLQVLLDRSNSSSSSSTSSSSTTTTTSE